MQEHRFSAGGACGRCPSEFERRTKTRCFCVEGLPAFGAIAESVSWIDSASLLVKSLMLNQKAVSAHATHAEQRGDINAQDWHQYSICAHRLPIFASGVGFIGGAGH